MKTKLVLVLLLAVALLVTSVSAVAPEVPGNGIDLKGQHFTLNIVAAKAKESMPDNLGGHTIFVTTQPTNGKVITSIMLTEGEFAVLDKNGSDDGVVSFQLPYPLTETDGSGTACYEIFARALSPKGSANMTTCFDETIGSTTTRYCDTGTTITLKRPDGHGVGKFTKVTTQLTTVFGAPIFQDPNLDYLWEYEYFGLKHAQLRFYPIAECHAAPTV